MTGENVVDEGIEAEMRSGSAPEEPAGLGEEPETTGTLFIMILFLVALVGMWTIVYLMLLER